MEMKKIYIEGKPEVINAIMTLIREHIGVNVNAVDLNPELKEE